MTPRPIMDGGPGLNFFALNKERLLIATVGVAEGKKRSLLQRVWMFLVG